MTKFLSVLSVIALVFALVLGTYTAARAIDQVDLATLNYGRTNIFGSDDAYNVAGMIPDRDTGFLAPSFDYYGLHGTLSSTQ